MARRTSLNEGGTSTKGSRTSRGWQWCGARRESYVDRRKRYVPQRERYVPKGQYRPPTGGDCSCSGRGCEGGTPRPLEWRKGEQGSAVASRRSRASGSSRWLRVVAVAKRRHSVESSAWMSGGPSDGEWGRGGVLPRCRCHGGVMVIGPSAVQHLRRKGLANVRERV